MGEVAVDIVKDLDLESLKDLQAPSLLAHQVQGAEGERDPDVPEKKGFFLDDVIKAFEPSQKEPARVPIVGRYS